MADKTPPPHLDLALWEDECADVPTWEELGAESLCNADSRWAAAPVDNPERLVIWLRRLRRWFRRGSLST